MYTFHTNIAKAAVQGANAVSAAQAAAAVSAEAGKCPVWSIFS